MGTARPLEHLRVLVVDDHADTLDTLAIALQSQGAEVRSASMAGDAFEMLRDFRPHVLVSDLAMPALDGYALIEKVRGLPADEGGRTPALAVTANAYPQTLDRSLEMGFDEWMAKPVEPQALVAAVARLARRGA